MQNRYFGDVGDFGKYGLLRRICGVGAEEDGEALSLGVVWYLVGDQSHNEDGKHTTYLYKPEEYRDCDPGLFDGLKSLLEGPGPRAVSMIERSRLVLLPHGTKYVSEPLTREGRSEWLSRAIEEVRDRDVVFLDPDIGFQPPSVRADSKSAVQYVLWREAERFSESQDRQTLIFYHHLNRTKRWDDQIDDKLHEIGSRLGGDEPAIPLLFRRGTGRVFFVVPSEEHRDLVRSRVLGMAKDAHWSRHARIGGAEEGVPVGVAPLEREGDPLTSWAAGMAADTHRRKRTGATEKATIRVGTWNTEWAKADSPKGERIRSLLAAPDCDILCVTEVGSADILPEDGNVIDAGTDWGYRIPKASPGCRKVLLWSKRPWTPVFDPLQAELPGGRLVAGTTDTPLGKIMVVGVCIPWRDAHVTTGMANRKPWEDHLAWLSGFERLSYAHSTWRTVVLGDFNQRIPRGKVAPLRVHGALERSFRFLKCSTAGAFVSDPVSPGLASPPDLWRAELQGPSDGAPGTLIDHVAHSEDLILRQPRSRRKGVRSIGVFPQQDLGGARLSDHSGVWVDLKV